MLYELVYNSMAVPANLDQVELEKILAGARARNREMGITGLLLFHKGEFVQLLEGERAAVETVYHDIIVKDRRHRALTVCWEQPVAHRNFTDWSMGFPRMRELDMDRSPGLQGYLDGGVDALDLAGPASTGRKLLLAIYAQFQTPAAA
jgi:hypothetical protein